MDIFNYVGIGSLWDFGGLTISFIIILIWGFIWKGLALWTAARRGEKMWFVVLLVVSTVGILEIIYLFVITKEGKPLFTKILDKIRSRT